MKTLDPWKERGLKMVEDLPRKTLTLGDIRTSRWTKAKNGRLLPLNSEAWSRLRRQVLNEQPLCQYCPPGVITPATEVDHKNNNPADNSRDNLASACKPCHSIKTMADMHGRPARMGCDSDGNPINPSHPWNKAHTRPPGQSDGQGEHEPRQQSPAGFAPEPTCTPDFIADCKTTP